VFEALVDQRDELLAVLRSLVPAIRASAGCVSCQLLASDADPRQFVITEVWESREAHKEAVARIPAEALRHTMTLLTDVPKGDFYSVVA
jgi:quinol monooxygenase YgiN